MDDLLYMLNTIPEQYKERFVGKYVQTLKFMDIKLHSAISTLMVMFLIMYPMKKNKRNAYIKTNKNQKYSFLLSHIIKSSKIENIDYENMSNAIYIQKIFNKRDDYDDLKYIMNTTIMNQLSLLIDKRKFLLDGGHFI